MEQNPAIPADVQEQLIDHASTNGLDIVPTEQVEQALLDAGLTRDQADAVTDDYGDAQLEALKKALLAVALLALVSFWFTRRLPSTALPQPAAADSHA